MTRPVSAARPDFAFRHPLRVRWAEVDAQGVVFNGHYLMYADVCCTEYFRAAGIPQWSQTAADDALDPYVVRATLDYAASARFDDLLTLCGRVSRLGTSSFTFECRIERAGERLCTVQVVSVNVRAGASCPLPEPFRAAVLAFEGAVPQP